MPLLETMDESNKRLMAELANFQEIAGFLNPSPGDVPSLDGVDICGFSRALHQGIGGDHVLYIDFKRRYDLDGRIAAAEGEVAAKLARLKRRAGILVADVSGHRMTDAMIAAMLHQAFLLGVHYELDRYGEVTTRLFEHLNTRFYRTTAINKYFTMIYGEITDRGNFRFLSSGHPRPAIFSREFGRFMPVSEDRLVSFPPVGMLPSSADPDGRVNPGLDRQKKRYAINEIDLMAVGDILLLYTDGLSEHADGSYFPELVEGRLRQMRDATAAEICEGLQTGLQEVGPPEDDFSAVVIRKTA